MSVIQTIRNRYGKIAGAVIAIALVGFIISDARNGSFGSFFGGHDSNIMKVDGAKIEPKQYQECLKEYETLYAMFNKGRALDDATRAQMNEQVIQMLVYESVVDKQCDKLGIQVSEEEKKDLIYGENADPIVKQFQIDGQQIFINQQTNSFDPQIIKYMEKQFAEEPQKIDPTGKLREQWENVKSYVKRNARINKFNNMVGASAYVPNFIAKRAAADQNSVASIQYVKVPYTDIQDNQLKVTDEDLNAYIQKHSGLFKKDEPTRSIEYVSFDIIPAAADTARVVEALTQLKGELATAKDDKTFVNNKSDETNSYSDAYLNKRTFMSRYADTLMSVPVGEVYGPYFENNSYKITKIVDRKTLPDSVKCRHILVRTKDHDKEILSDSAAKLRIDSAIAMLKSGAKFDSVVVRFSEDEGSNKKGGEYTFTLQQRPTISKEFGDFVFEGKTGESKTVKVSNDNYSGYHYIEIVEQNGIAPSVKLATVAKILAPSDSTVNAIYGRANEFAGKNPTAPEFDAAIKKQNFDRRIADNIKVNNFSIQGIGPSREVVRWAYDHKVGEISPVFQLGEQRYLVAKVSSIDDKGTMGITPANRPLLEQKVKEEMKTAMITKKYAGSASLATLSASANQPVQHADTVVLGAGYVNGLGFEPKVLGYTFDPAFQLNTLSPGIKGQGGVYFITVTARNANPLPEGGMLQMILAQQRMQQESQLRNALGQMLMQNLSKKADVKYNQDNF